MEDLVAHCTWADQRLLQDERLRSLLPDTIFHALRSANGPAYLQTVSAFALMPSCTDSAFGLYRPLMPEIFARWWRTQFSGTFSDHVVVLSCVARILPFARYLRQSVTKMIGESEWLSKLSCPRVDLQDLSEQSQQSLFLAVFRLLSCDLDTFSHAVHPAFLSSLFQHTALSIRLLAIRCFVQVMHLSDENGQQLTQKHLDKGPVRGTWETESIDYRLLTLYEERRWRRLRSELKALERPADPDEEPPTGRLSESDFLADTAILGGVLMPQHGTKHLQPSKLVLTPSTSQNLHNIGKALLDSKPILITGRVGSGKTSIVHGAARTLDKLSSMITLHLNEQTDAKSLLGTYTTSNSGSFVWQPGILIRAMQEGRWVLIEDIDRVPLEILGVIRPVIEKNELFLPGRKEYVKPVDGFRVLATSSDVHTGPRSTINHGGGLFNPRLWSVVNVIPQSTSELEILLQQKFSPLGRFTPMLLAVHLDILRQYQEHYALKAVQSRTPSLRDLSKWCRRVQRRLSSKPEMPADVVPENVSYEIFKDAIDCYTGCIASDNAKEYLASCIAKKMQIPPQQVQHCLRDEIVKYSQTKRELQIGRACLSKRTNRQNHIGHDARSAPFAFTRPARRTMEGIAVATTNLEPLLLVGETGIGKTAAVQHLATALGQKLIAINLSQQSEATDLIGGLKPVTTRSLILPLVEKFMALFDDTFSAKKNEKYQASIRTCVNRQNWQRLVTLWDEATDMAQEVLQVQPENISLDPAVQAKKRRKLTTPKYEELRRRWQSFSNSLNQLRPHILRKDNHLTFSIVEGRLVQAVREGEWVLLDEINLATSETLDSITSLLGDDGDEPPYLMLVEAGKVEKIVAHPSFRIFAAMNPATDTGKKDLASGIRSRFTEIYVPPGDSDLEDLILMIQAYLGPLLTTDNRAASDLAHLYLAVKKHNEEKRLADGAREVPHFTVRSLVRCLLYVLQHAPRFGLRRAICEGFNMSFCTVLSTESEQLISPLIDRHILASIKNIRSFMSQVPKTTTNSSDHILFKHHLVPTGPLVPNLQPDYIRTPSVERNLVNLARAVSMQRFPILIQGPTSSGKTSMVEYLAKYAGHRFVRINNHEHTDLQEYLGSYASGDDGRLVYQEGVLLDALRHGHWIVLDELNLAPSDVLEALNRLLDDNRELLIPESQEVVQPHPNFMLFATQNPAGMYGGRKRLSRAFRNRFLELHFDDIPEDELEHILRERSKIPPSFCTQIVSVYKKLSLQRQSTRMFEQRHSFATLRDLFRWAARPADSRLELAEQGFMLLGERVRDATERSLVKAVLEETMKVSIREDLLYHQSKVSVKPMAAAHENIVWTPSLRRLFVLVSKALQNNEPVLLVGETGCGKTQVCQLVADAFGKRLGIYNAHTNTETGDLIGSQRPTRGRSEHGQKLRKNFGQIFGEGMSEKPVSISTIDDLIDRFNRLDNSSYDADVVGEIREGIRAYRSLFEWADGRLVTAMREGEHFLLDEISLADDSVLERLNSVLEPARTILLAEKGSTDSPVVAQPGFQFLATMNPGGDYGKRELSAALRNRLTEIWVPQLDETDDVLPILEWKMITADPQLPGIMLNFSKWFAATFQGTLSTTIPLRSLITWADFVHQMTDLGTTSDVLHGAAMVYIDSLGANPAGLLSTGFTDINHVRRQCVEKLAKLLECPLPPLYDQPLSFQLEPGFLEVGGFRLRKRIARTDMPHFVFDTSTTLKNTMRIMRALQMSRPVLLEGSPGVGKTAIVSALAKITGNPLTRINLSDQTDLMDLFGSDVPVDSEGPGNFAWRDGPLLRAMQAGEWVLLDEMNLASQSVLEGLNSCLDHRKEVFIAELDRTFACHSDFTLFAAQNAHQQGGGRKGLPKSFVNRFTVVYADPFQRDDLVAICTSQYPARANSAIEAMVNAIAEAQDVVNTRNFMPAGGPWEFNLRDLYRWFALQQQSQSSNVFEHFETIFSQRFRDPEQARIVRGVVPESLEQPSLYHNLTSRAYQVGNAILDRRLKTPGSLSSAGETVPTRLLPQVKSTIMAVNKNWPVILVGSSGSGKTGLIRSLASISGAQLVEAPLNADTDTMDLIGGFEQHDPQTEIVAIIGALKSQSWRLIEKACSPEGYRVTLPFLLVLWAKCHQVTLPLVSVCEDALELGHYHAEFTSPACRLMELTRVTTGTRPGFIWNDGILVDALRQGSWLVLDNANLCNPAVLDRLNSLLEPDGHLILSEHHGGGEAVTIVKRHPDFRIFLTMNPRYGELSRAMRNRSLEIFCPSPEDHEGEPQIPTYPTDSSVYRLRLLDLPSTAASPAQPEAVATALDHVSFLDMEASSGASVGDGEILSNSELTLAISARLELPTKFRKLLESSQMMQAGQYGQSSAWWLQQASLWLVNEPLLTDADDANGALHQVNLQRILLDSIAIRRTISSARNRSGRGEVLTSTALDRSIAHSRASMASTTAPTPPIADFCEQVCDLLEAYIKGQWSAATRFPSLPYSSIQDLMSLVRDILALSQRPHVPEGLLQAYTQIGRAIGRATVPALGITGESFLQKLSLFSADFTLIFGQSLQRMWAGWKPAVASNLAQLNQLVEFEGVMAQFDRSSLTIKGHRRTLAHLRIRFVEIYFMILNGTRDTSAAAKELENSIRQLSSVNATQAELHGHFTSAFQMLHTILFQPEVQILNEDLQLVSVFAERPMIYDVYDLSVLPAASRLSSIVKMAGLSQEPSKWSAWRNTFSLRLIKQLGNCTGQSLEQLSIVREEAKALTILVSAHASAVSASVVEMVDEQTRALLLGILAYHGDLLDASLAEIVLAICSGPLTFDRLAAFLHDHEQAWVSAPRSRYFSGILDKYILPAVLSLARKCTDPSEAVTRTGHALFYLSMACLQMLVPEKAYDPVLLLQAQRSRHQDQLHQLQTRLAAQKDFTLRFSGQTTSLAIRQTEAEIAELGAEPSPAAVARPVQSELHLVQEVFSNLLRSIVMKSPERVLLAAVAGPWKNADVSVERRLEEAESLQLTISRVIDRLTSLNRAYDDLVKPVMWNLQALSFATDLIVVVEKRKPEAESIICHIAQRCPLLGAKPEHVLNNGPSTHRFQRGPEFLDLECLAMMSSVTVNGRDDGALWQEFLFLTDAIYDEWKTRLGADQTAAAKKSRYYAYRGDDDLDEEGERAAVAEMFPSFEPGTAAGVSSDPQPVMKYDALSNAVRLAQIQTRFLSADHDESLLEKHILRLMALLPSGIPEDGFELSPVPSEDLLPGALLQLHQKVRWLKGTDADGSVNIYTDGNIPEYQKLDGLVERIRYRFHGFWTTWPEHAIPLEVLACCKELLSLHIDDPLAKVLTKAEKLYSIIDQWQAVTSREFSAAELYDELCQLIVSWRRLELSSWSRLLSIERQRSEEDASAWYFVLYEATLSNPRQVPYDDSMNAYADELAHTLESFLQMTTIGQFSARLRLLQSFERVISGLCEDGSSFLVVRNVLSNLLGHFRRYEASVNKILQDKGTELEKAIREQIKLASWKDTNINALRESARRSHNKLFKIVRKYRSLLAQPFQIQEGLGVTAHDSDLGHSLILAEPRQAENIHLATLWCRDNLDGWTSRPERLVNPLGAAGRMRTLYAAQQSEFRIDLEVAHFRNRLKSLIKDLRGQTPSSLTSDSKDLVGQLKGVKQALFADTIKSIRHMGIRRDIGASELDTQSDTAKVLASAPSFDLSRDSGSAQRANDAFHDLLDLMPHVRKAPADHAEDIRPADIRRGASLMEGILSVLIKQRKDVFRIEEQFSRLLCRMEKLRSFQKFEDEIFLPEDWKSSASSEVRRYQLAWLPKILQVSCRILEIQSEHSQLDNANVLALLRRYGDDIHVLTDQTKASLPLPHGLRTAGDAENDETVDMVFADFEKDIEQAMVDMPHAAFVLRQIIPWTALDDTDYEASADGLHHKSLKQLDELIHGVLERIFHVIERTSQDLLKMPGSNEEAGWLVEGHERHGNSLRLLQISQASISLDHVLTSVVHLPFGNIHGAARLLTTMIPVFEQYLSICRHAIDYALASHAETGELSILLARSFVTLAKDGFCSPHDDSAGKEESGQVESGTGLGEGEGAEDISKDIGADEDLSELAKTKQAPEDGDEIEASKDAVAMDREDLEGQNQADAQTGSDEDGEDTDQAEGSELDEETGSVDDLDPTAVDEKQWEGLNEEEGKELQDGGTKSQSKQSDDKTAAQQKPKEAAEDQSGDEKAEEDGEEDAELDGQAQGFEHEDANEMDAHVEQEDALDLPEEMQLNGEDAKEIGDSDDDMDQLSDIDQKAHASNEVSDDEDAHEAEDEKDNGEGSDDTYDMMDDFEAVADDDEPMEDQPDLNSEHADEDHRQREDDLTYDIDETGDGDNGIAGRPQEDEGGKEGKQSRPDQSRKQPRQEEADPLTEEANEADGEEDTGGRTRGGKREVSSSEEQAEALKKLGDILDRWHERREIHSAGDDPLDNKMDDIEMVDTDLEHVKDDADRGDTQALGAASHDQAQTLDQDKAVLEENTGKDEDRIPEVNNDETLTQEAVADQFSRLQTDTSTCQPSFAGAFIPDRTLPSSYPSTDNQTAAKDEADIPDQPPADSHLSSIPLTLMSPAASSLWSTLTTRTHTLSQILTEQLRLILTPTTATKLRGDYRTGKRLNTKRIIPYIASNYKRDKIWMRRSVPSRRSYQIMLALDDSKSMASDGAGLLALETLTMTCTALSMLESGDLCVLAFGNEEHVRVAHPFGTPFTPDRGAQVVSNFSFRQTNTDVKKLVAESIAIFADARLKSTQTSQADLWQLMLIISDGICDSASHESIRALVRKAKEERIMIVFIIVDSLGTDNGSSIMDLTQASFEPDDAGEMKLVMKRYLERFPFEYYLVVRDVRDLPAVLSNALKGWFGEVVDA